VPISCAGGRDNVVARSKRSRGIKAQTLLEHLENDSASGKDSANVSLPSETGFARTPRFAASAAASRAGSFIPAIPW